MLPSTVFSFVNSFPEPFTSLRKYDILIRYEITTILYTEK